jgi:hypothetical protein
MGALTLPLQERALSMSSASQSPQIRPSFITKMSLVIRRTDSTTLPMLCSLGKISHQYFRIQAHLFANRASSLDKLCSTEGYIHSESYWALVASAEVSNCPMCVLTLNALRGGCQEDFDGAIKLLHPLRNDLQMCLRAVPRERRPEQANLEVMILNTAPLLPHGRLLISAAPVMNDLYTPQQFHFLA